MLMYQTVYENHFTHSFIHITAISTFTFSSEVLLVGVQFLSWGALVVERASKQYGHAHTFYRSTFSVGLAGADCEFPVIRAATELMHDLRRKSN